MRQILSKYSREVLVIAFTLTAALLVQLIMFSGYAIFEIDIRLSEIVIGIIAPLLITPLVTWYLLGLLKKLDSLEKDMRNRATYDQLTNVLTRRAFFEKADDLINLAKREKPQLSILMVDLDNFKQINDTYGHAAGDLVLEMFGKMINKNKRKTDLIGRIGGEEFAFLLWGMSAKEAYNYTDFLHENLRNMAFQYNRNIIRCSMSIGVSSYMDIEMGISELVKQADDALYLAKETGRNKTVIHS